MDSIKCEAFLAAVDHGSLTAAGEVLGYTQPGITRMIRSLEAELGFTLFARTQGGVTPTENGKAMIPIFRDIVRTNKNAEEMSSAINGILKGSLTIGSYFSVSSRILPPVLKSFTEKYPNIKIVLREGGNSEMAEWLADKSVDFCFAAKPDIDTQFHWIPICTDELTVWLPKDHKSAGKKSFPIERLSDEPFIITMPDEDTDIDRLIDKYKINPDIRFSTADAFTTFCMVEAGLGISLNQRLIFEKWKGDVVALPFDPPQYVELGISLNSMSEASPATKKFIEYVKRYYEK